MSGEKVSTEYANSIIFDLQKAFWDERGKGARFRVTNVGRAYFLDKCLAQIKSNALDEVAGTIGRILQEEGIVDQVDHEQEEQLLRLRVGGCMHHSVEMRMLEHGVEPFTCIPANLMALAIEDKLKRQVELTEVSISNGTCEVLLVVFEKRPGE
ncbi:MAG TPA: hypothetical protein G4O14_01190 [Anaerolineae bacterium]|nr:hypothetical protein [Anaerolineae bacterium]